MLNPMDLTGRRVLVTGASSGIGRETAILLSNLGAQLILVGRNPERLAETAARMQGAGHRCEPIDLATVDDIPRWLKQLVADTGPLSALVHSAGRQITRPLQILKSEDVDGLMHINLGVAISLAKAFRQRGVYQTPGSIVLLSSVTGLVGQPGIAAYAASKGAIIALTKSLAMELAREHIRVNCVAPGTVMTEMTEKVQQQLTPEQFAAIQASHPLGIGTALDVAYAIAFLIADTGRWITGSTLVVDGGYTAH